MIYFDTFAFYTVFCSAVLVYGIGVNKVADFRHNTKANFTFFTKMILSIFVTAILTWEFIKFILVPLKLVELYPIISFLIFVCLNVLFEITVRIATRIKTSEFIVSYLIVLLSISESSSLVDVIVICVSCFLSFLILFPFVTAFQKKIAENGQKINLKYYSLFFLFIALLVLAISAFDVSWLNKGVIL